VFSNYDRTGTAAESRHVHCSAWGQFVAATGYGDVFFGDGDVNRSYTGTFSGTSAATPQVAGVVACLQGLAKQFYGIPLATATTNGGSNNIRNVVVGGGFPQCNNVSGNPTWFGFDPEANCGPDIVPEQPFNRIGPYVQPRSSGDSVLSQWSLGFDQSPLMHDLYILRGNHFVGNIFSTKASDNNYVLLRTLYTQRNFVPTLNSPSAEANSLAAKVKYLATGYTGDIMLRGTSTLRSENIVVSAEVQVSDPSLLFIEMYDWNLNRWMFVGFNQLAPSAPGTEAVVTHTAIQANRFFHKTSGNMYVRCYVLIVGRPELGGSESSGPPTVGPFIRLDWVNLRPGWSIGVPPL
jgi:hypothetical protein